MDSSQQPPRKKRKRKGDSYEDFVNVIQKLGHDYDPRLFTCLKYTQITGVTCNSCCADEKLKGPFSKTKPVTKFNYTNLKDHVWAEKHINRMDDELRILHPKTMAQAMKEKTGNATAIATVVISPLKKALNAIKLLHMKCKEGLPDLKVRRISKFIKVNCNEAIADELSSIHNSDELLDAANIH